MNKRRTSWLKCVMLLAILAVVAAGAAEKKAMPKEDVVEVPAIGQGLCVANVFQSNMVLQRDKPLNIWGWADPGEEVTVSFAGQQARGQGGGRPVLAGDAQADSRQQHAADHDGQGQEHDADAGEHPGRRRLDSGRPEQHGISHQQRGRRGAGNRLGQLPADPAPDHAGRERASTRCGASSACTSGATGPSGTFARATGTSVRPKPSGSSPPSATSSGGGCTWPPACRSG